MHFVEYELSPSLISLSHGNTDALNADFPPLLQRVAQSKHLGKIAGNHKEDLHAKGMDEVVKQRQPPGGLGAVHMRVHGSV